MSSVSREAVYAALFAKVSGIAGLNLASRRLQHWTDVRTANQPALFQVQRTEEVTALPGLPARLVLQAAFYLYVATGNDTTEVPATQLNSFTDAITTALAPDPSTGLQTLGGLVTHCRISGKIETDEGTLGTQAVAIIPVEILLSD